MRPFAENCFIFQTIISKNFQKPVKILIISL